MRTLIIYDMAGSVIQTVTGTAMEPVGIPFMWVEVPNGKHVARVDVSGETHVAVFEDLPKSSEQLMQDRITDLELTIAEMMTH